MRVGKDHDHRQPLVVVLLRKKEDRELPGKEICLGIRADIEIKNICLYNIPFWPVGLQSLDCPIVDFYGRKMFESGHFEG